MQFTRTLTDVRDQVEADDTGKWDSVVRCHEITMHCGRLVFPQAQAEDFSDGLALTPWAMSQACQRLGLPVAYFKRCPDDLQDANFNYWNRSAGIGWRFAHERDEPTEAWLLRAKGGTVRGVLSPRYSRLDNQALLAALDPLLHGTRYQVGMIQLTPESLHLRLVDPTIARDVLPGDRLLVAIHIANSEVGLRAVTVDACVFRVICSNGLIRRINSKSLLRQRHIHVSEPRFADLLANALREAVTVAAGFIEQMVLAIKTPVPHPDHAIETLGELWNLPKQTVEWIKFALYGEPHPETLYGLVNAVTNAAQRLPVDDRFELETLAGVLVDTTSTRAADTALRGRILSGGK